MVANYTLANELHHVLSMRAVSTKDELGPPSLEVLVTYFSAHVYTKQLLVALLTWVLYEILITTGESVELFWKQRWNLSKSLFFIVRTYFHWHKLIKWIGPNLGQLE
ncbi:hypothetical protein FRC16_010644 [Serendipita sp. 398]|nr:hypothetical protein FRC16_010644 [Serendipita sp. 398]